MLNEFNVIYVSRKGNYCSSYLRAFFDMYSIELIMYFSNKSELELMKNARTVMNLPFGIRRYRL